MLEVQAQLARVRGVQEARRRVVAAVEGVEKEDDGGESTVTAVKVDGKLVPCKQFVCTMGPWAALAQDWLDSGLLPPVERTASASAALLRAAVRPPRLTRDTPRQSPCLPLRKRTVAATAAACC